ncbi:hypothetical protein PsorP6_011781 [Peronosclerospora sorghi]|uniref:Uncharacterized protein n=1 Tax=Peronosclerospora sorghi TaxID=230839 RepID=A0ACC0WK49_9STRA|nr:hypothetical protein PsorP6_011781 [Peronosclerospora sorghi]
MNAGYAIVIKRSEKKRDTVELLRSCCPLPQAHETKDCKSFRKTGSRLQGCPWTVHERCGVDIFWCLKRVADKIEHSHEPVQDLSVHPYYRRLDCAATKQVESMALAGVEPKHVITAIR